MIENTSNTESDVICDEVVTDEGKLYPFFKGDFKKKGKRFPIGTHVIMTHSFNQAIYLDKTVHWQNRELSIDIRGDSNALLYYYTLPDGPQVDYDDYICFYDFDKYDNSSIIALAAHFLDLINNKTINPTTFDFSKAHEHLEHAIKYLLTKRQQSASPDLPSNFYVTSNTDLAIAKELLGSDSNECQILQGEYEVRNLIWENTGRVIEMRLAGVTDVRIKRELFDDLINSGDLSVKSNSSNIGSSSINNLNRLCRKQAMNHPVVKIKGSDYGLNKYLICN